MSQILRAKLGVRFSTFVPNRFETTNYSFSFFFFAINIYPTLFKQLTLLEVVCDLTIKQSIGNSFKLTFSHKVVQPLNTSFYHSEN